MTGTAPARPTLPDRPVLELGSGLCRDRQGVKDKTYKVGWDYFDADTGGLGLFGFMEGQTPTKGVADLPPKWSRKSRI